MRKIALVLVLGAMAVTANAQFYVSATGGYALGIPSSKIGDESINGNQKVNFGTFGEGFNTQLRLGYFFNKTWGIDISGGYLHGADQTIRREISQKQLAGTPFTATIDGNVQARGRVFGAALSVIYNFTDNFYGRFGVLTKLGGKTEAIGNSVATVDRDIPLVALGMLPAGTLPTSVATNMMTIAGAGYTHLAAGTQLETSYTEEFKGKMPFGTIAALGYKYNVSKNISIFAELEYMNIGVVRESSELKNFNQTFVATFKDASGAKAPHTVSIPYKKLTEFTDGVYVDRLRDNQTYLAKTTYVEELSATETDITKKLTEKASYSSLGFNFGVTCSF